MREVIEDVFDKDVRKSLKSSRLLALVQFQKEDKRKSNINRRKNS